MASEDEKTADVGTPLPVARSRSSAELADPSVVKESRWLLIRSDLLLMPLLTIAFGLQYYDKAILGSATIWGILEDLNLSPADYSQASAAFYYGYLVGALPMSILVQRFRNYLNYFLGSMIVLWGAITMLTCVVTNSGGLIAQRIFLGLVESAVSPGFVAVTRMWYTKKEQPLRLGIWYSATGLFSIFSGLVNHALGEKSTSLAPWKLMFLVPGAFTIFFGFLIVALLPSSPLHRPVVPIPYYNAFSTDEREAISHKVWSNLTGDARGHSKWSWAQAREAARDVHIWIYFFMGTAIYVTNGAVTVFGPILVRSIGFTSLRATILLTPGGATTAISIYVFCFLATLRAVTRWPGARTALLVTSCWPVLIGAIMCWRGDWTNKAVPLAGYYLLPTFGTPFVLMLGSSTANMAGSTKQAITSGVIFIGYNCGNIASSYILVPSEAAQNYPTTFRIVIGVMCATMALALLQAALFARENRRRDRKELPASIERSAKEDSSSRGSTDSPEPQTDGLTDRENLRFRYTF